MRKIIISVEQLKKILKTELPKYPMLLKGLDKAELEELSKLLNKKKKT